MNDGLNTVLGTQDPLYRFLAESVLGVRLGFGDTRLVFEAYPLDADGTVVRFSERQTGVELVGKFYGRKWIAGWQQGAPELRRQLMHREYDNLQRLRTLGLDGYPHCVVRPLATCEDLDCLLVEDHVPGPDLESFVRQASQAGQTTVLHARLADLASFLFDLHQRTETPDPVEPSRALGYLDKLVGQLSRWRITSVAERRRLTALRQRWAERGVLELGRRVLTHGDPIPPHFLFAGPHGVTTIDLERLWPGDRAADLGCVVAELKHLFFLYTGDRWASEPSIRHFYDCYNALLPRSSGEDLPLLTERGRFHMGCYLLRIARNSWLDLDYRRCLLAEAQACLAL